MEDRTHVPQTLIQRLQRAALSGDFDTMSHLLDTLARYPFTELAASRSERLPRVARCYGSNR